MNYGSFNKIIVEHTCKITPLGLMPTISIAISVSMPVMYFLISINANGIITTLLYVGLLAAIIYILIAEATFRISAQGIERSIHTKRFNLNSIKETFYAWSDLKSYKNGTERGKYRGEYQYLELNFKDGASWKITDEYGDKSSSYQLFLNVFLAQVNAHNEQAQNRYNLSVPSFSNPITPIERKKTFYEGILGKFFTLIIGFFIVGIFIYGSSYIKGTVFFKLYFVLILVFLYLFYRTFISHKK